MALSFLDAMKMQNQSHPASVCVEREYVVYYRLDLGNGPKEASSVVRAFSRQDARKRFEQNAPLAIVERVD